MIPDCAHSECKKAAFAGSRYCLVHGKALAMALGQMRYENNRREIVEQTPSLHVSDAHEVAEKAAGVRPQRPFKQTQRGGILIEISGGRFEEKRSKH